MTRRAHHRARTGGGGGGGVVVLAVAVAGLWWFTQNTAVLGSTAAAAQAALGAAAPVAAPAAAVADVPAGYVVLYRRAGGMCAGLDWALLAGVGKVETDHGRSRLPGVRSGTNYAGAGPMQFLGPTFREVRGNHPDVGPDLYDPAHAIPAAAHYLCDGGLIDGRGVRAALWTYNRSRPYATDVLEHAARYRAAAGELR